MSTLNVNSIDKESGSTLTIGGSGTTVTLGSGASQSGFGEAAYAANASASTGAVNVDASDNLQFDSGYGSTATAYGCRAWVNFNGTGTVAIRDSGNVSSITDNGTGNFTINLTTSMPDTNYAFFGFSRHYGATGHARGNGNVISKTTSSVQFETVYVSSTGGAGGANDDTQNDCILFR